MHGTRSQDRLFPFENARRLELPRESQTTDGKSAGHSKNSHVNGKRGMLGMLNTAGSDTDMQWIVKCPARGSGHVEVSCNEY